MNAACKRAIDVVLAATGLVLAAPVMLVIALLLKMEEKAEVIFSQQRLGREGKPFRIHKFRKFPSNWGTKGPGVTVAGDARMTRIGAILERTKLDELPQLWNILKGEMSFVGPRPESMRYAELFKGEYAGVLDHVPGIFGPNQVEFRNESAMYPADESPEDFYKRELFPRKARNDLEYFSRANCLQDLVWIFRGLTASLVGVVDWRKLMGLHAKILFSDVTAAMLAWCLANLTLFQVHDLQGMEHPFFSGFALFPPVVLAVMFLGGGYSHPARFFSFSDAKRLALIASFSWALGFAIFTDSLDRGTSLMLLPLGWLYLLFFMAAVRMLARMKWEKEKDCGCAEMPSFNLLIYGAGKRGGALLSWVKYGSDVLAPVGFLDDNADLHGKRIFGLKVMGSERDISTLVSVHGITHIWMTFIPDDDKRERMSALCCGLGLELDIIPEAYPFSRYARREHGHGVGEVSPGTELEGGSKCV